MTGAVMCDLGEGVPGLRVGWSGSWSGGVGASKVILMKAGPVVGWLDD